MTSQTGSHVEHGWYRVPATGENGQWLMTAGQLIVAAATVIGCVAGRAGCAVDRGELTVKIVFPARRVGSRPHNLVAGGALSLAGRGRGNVLMAHVALSVGGGSLLAVPYPESGGVEGGLHVPHVTDRHIQTGGRIRMAGGAVGHPELGRDDLRSVVAFHTVQHAGKSKIRQTGASGNSVVAGSAVDMELIPLFKMRDVGEPDVHILSRYGDGSNHTAGFSETGILDFLRRVTAAAAVGIERSIQLRLHSRFGMASGALDVSGKLGENSLLIELVTERAIGAEAGDWVDASLLIDVHGVGELKQDGARGFITRKREQIGRAVGREILVALRAHHLVDIVEVVGMAGHALVMPGAL